MNGLELLLGLIQHKNPEELIQNKRNLIAEQLKQVSRTITDESVKRIAVSDLQLMFTLYDESFFNGALSGTEAGFEFSLSRRMTKSAGMTICPRIIGSVPLSQIRIEIRIGVDFFFQYDSVDGGKAVGGTDTESALHALQLVFEHELCHAVEFLLFHKSSCAKQRFQTMALNLFGHTGHHHELPTWRNIAAQQLGLRPGDTVRFLFEGTSYTGLLYKINKRGIIMVKDSKGIMVDKQGQRYSKYYVPLDRLTRV